MRYSTQFNQLINMEEIEKNCIIDVAENVSTESGLILKKKSIY